MKVTKEEFRLWLDNPVTETLMDVLREDRESCNDALLLAAKAGNTIGSANMATTIEVLDLILNVTFEDIQSEEDNNES